MRLTTPQWSRRAALRAGGMGLAAAACSRGGAKSGTGRRIVSLGGTVSEILFAFGLGDEIVGVDVSSVYPAAATKLAQVGYHRRFSAEGVIGLGPTLLVHSEAAGPASALSQVAAAGIETLAVAEAEDLPGARERITKLAAALDRVDAGRELCEKFDADLARARALANRAQTRPRVLFLYARGAGTLLVAGRETVANLMIDEAGGQNAVVAFTDFRPLSAESVIAAAPEVILLPARGLSSVGGVEGLRSQPGLSETPALRDGRVVAIDDLTLLGLGPRTGQAVAELAKALHPELGS